MNENKKVYTAYGIQAVAPNGVGLKGESLWNFSTNNGHYIDSGKEGVDDLPVNVQNETFIPSHKLGFAKLLEPHAKLISGIQDKQRKYADGKTPQMSSLYKQTQQFQNKQVDKYIDINVRPIAELQAKVHEYENLRQQKFDSGKIPTFARILPTLTGVGASLAKLAHWTSNPVRQINTYLLNPYGNRALNILGSMRANPYPAIKDALDSERRSAYSINRSGGLSGSLRYLGRVAQSIGNAQNIANINFAAEQENNKYKQNFANALLQEGNSMALRRQQALQHDWADYVASHGRKTTGIEQSLSDMVGQVGGGFKNEFQYRTYQDALDLYRQEVENNTKNTRNTRLLFNPTQAYIRNPYIDDMYGRETKTIKTKNARG